MRPALEADQVCAFGLMHKVVRRLVDGEALAFYLPSDRVDVGDGVGREPKVRFRGCVRAGLVWS